MRDWQGGEVEYQSGIQTPDAVKNLISSQYKRSDIHLKLEVIRKMIGRFLIIIVEMSRSKKSNSIT